MSHAGSNIAMLRNMGAAYTGARDIDGILDCLPLSEVAPKDFPILYFASVDSTLVFDRANSSVWAIFISSEETLRSHGGKGQILSTLDEEIVEEDESEEEDGDEKEEKMRRETNSSGITERTGERNAIGLLSARVRSCSVDITTAGSSSSGSDGSSATRIRMFDRLLCSEKMPILASIFSFIDNSSIGALLCCQKSYKHLLYQTEDVRERRRKGAEAFTRRSKILKRKQAKNKNLGKSQKKDGFARGIS
jgi:hypothetical protein